MPSSNQSRPVSAYLTLDVPRSEISRNSRLCIYYQERQCYTLLCLLLGGGSSKEVKVNLEPLVDGGVNGMVLVTDLLWCQTLLYGFVLCSRAVLVRPTHKEDIPATQSTVPDEYFLDLYRLRTHKEKHAGCRKQCCFSQRAFFKRSPYLLKTSALRTQPMMLPK